MPRKTNPIKARIRLLRETQLGVFDGIKRMRIAIDELTWLWACAADRIQEEMEEKQKMLKRKKE